MKFLENALMYLFHMFRISILSLLLSLIGVSVGFALTSLLTEFMIVSENFLLVLIVLKYPIIYLLVNFIVFFVSVKRKYISFSKYEHLKNILSVVFIIFCLIWTFEAFISSMMIANVFMMDMYF